MKNQLSFIVRLKRSYDYYLTELDRSADAPYPEYGRYLRSLGFFDLAHQVITACAMYPRSIDLCQENLVDLSYGIVNNNGIGFGRLSMQDLDRLSNLVLKTGSEAIECLAGHQYYFKPHQIPRNMKDDPEYATDLTAIADIKKINPFTFVVDVKEDDMANLVEEFTQNSRMPERRQMRSY